MIKVNLKNVFAISILMSLTSHTALAANGVKDIKVQRNFVNLGFEDVPPLSAANFGGIAGKEHEYCYNYANDGGSGTRTQGTWTRGHCLFDQRFVAGWRTTAPTVDGADAEIKRREIEFWKVGGWETKYNNVFQGPHKGTYFAELNGHKPAALYQNVCVSEDDQLSWSLYHRVRGTDATKEKIHFYITDQIVDPLLPTNTPKNQGLVAQAGQIIVPESSKHYLKNQDGHTQFSSARTWTQHKSKDGELVALKDFLDGAKAKIMSFAFEAADISGANLEQGNFLDDIELNLNPGIEFSAESNQVFENKESQRHVVSFNVVGNMASGLKVKFVIKNDNVTRPAKYRFGTSTEGDFKLYESAAANAKEIDVTLDENNNLTFEYTMPYDASLDYETGVTIQGFAVEVFNNTEKDGSRFIPFEMAEDQTDFAVLDLEGCGTNVFDGFTYEIQDDDVDLIVKKKLVDEAPLPNTLVSYEIEVFNDSLSAAQDVRLKDLLGVNLSRDTSTQLQCEMLVEGGTTNCPITFDQNSVNQLFSEQGLSLGTMEGKARYKFTLSNMKIAAQDNTEKGEIINTVTVSTDQNLSFDVNLENNTAQAIDMYPSLSDLMNNDTGRSGTGVFVVNQNGDALWTREAAQNKAYFPLVVRNDAKYQQDYQLFSSSTEILRERENELYSALKGSSIQPFSSGIVVEFFAVGEAQCNANIGNAQHITQLTEVAPNELREYCAVVTLLDDAPSSIPVWFAIESMQNKLGDVILDAVVSQHQQQRELVLSNDQQAQVNIGGTYVFSHLLVNKGMLDEQQFKVSLNPLDAQDGFIYTAFVDMNSNGLLDSEDKQIQDADRFSLAKGQEKGILVKVQTPSTGANGMMSQVQLIVTPDNTNQVVALQPLINTDLILIGSNQLAIQKMQYKRDRCQSMSIEEIKAAAYQLQGLEIGGADCVIYRISIKNIGALKLTDIEVNDMYPAYTAPWASNNVLPMTDEDALKPSITGNQVNVTFPSLMPDEQKHMYFGVRLE